jgi:flagellum-specific ATP synthase
VASRVTSREQSATASALRRVLAARRAAQDLLDVGAYQRGANPLVDAAVDHEVAINSFLRQRLDEPVPAARSWADLDALVRRVGV